MTEQHYRVIADRDKGDDPQQSDIEEADRVTYGFIGRGFEHGIVRIERPVPTTNEPPEADATPDEAFELGEVHGYDKGYADGLAASPHPPTREQMHTERPYDEPTDHEYGAWETDALEEHALDILAVVSHRRALIQNGAER